MKETKDEKEKTNSIAKKTRKTVKKEASVDTKKEKAVAKKTTSKVASKTASKSAAKDTEKKVTQSKKIATKKITTKKAAPKKSTTSKVAKDTTAKSTTKVTTKPSTKATKKVTSRSVKKTEKASDISSKIISKKEQPKIQQKTFSEYYDLPYRYNQTIIKILAQTPHALFIYWDISDDDRNEMIKKYGDRFFYETKPVLLVHNKTLNSNFEIEVDDFTNSWYLRTPTSNCVFEIELGRKKITENEKINFENNSNILHIATSNSLESPNDHILKEKLTTVFFKNVKTNELEERDVSNYNVNNVYGLIDLYNDENGYENNPSSGFKIS